jgi:predicted P-loop ATPase
MGVDDTDYYYEVMKTFMLGAICRVFHPGCKFDYTIILYGSQGFGKSEFVRRLALCPEWFNDNFNTLDGDKASEKLAGMWMLELAELKALKSSKDSESIKAFLTSRYDTYRAPYERRTQQRPRMCVFAGTTNNMNVFVDKTGNRRFWPIITHQGRQTKEIFGDTEAVERDFRLAWAEAMAIYHAAKDKPTLKLSAVMEAEALKMQEQFSEEDYRVGMIQAYLDELEEDKVCVPQIIENVFKMEVEKMTKANRREIQEILENEIEGWHRLPNKDKGRTSCGKYGKQLAFIRENPDFD